MILNNEIAHLGDLRPGDVAEITGFEDATGRESFLYRLFEVGFLVGEKLEVMNEAPVSRNPMSIKVKGAIYAIRREDARLIRVKRSALESSK